MEQYLETTYEVWVKQGSWWMQSDFDNPDDAMERAELLRNDGDICEIVKVVRTKW